MPANLPAEAKSKLAKYSEAKTVEEKIKALEEFISSVPKHKGTENLLYWARSRLAELREELELKKRKKVGGGPKLFIEKERYPQIIIIGPPNVGKSSLLARLTNAKPEISPYPFTTTAPLPGIAKYKDVKLQLVDTPPVVPEEPESTVNTRVVSLARNADGILLVFSAADPQLKETAAAVLDILEKRGVVISRSLGVVRVKKSREVEGIRLVGDGKLVDMTEDDLRKLLAEYRIFNAVVEIEGNVTRDDVESSLLISRTYKPCVVALNKVDLAPGKEGELRKVLPSDVKIVSVSAERGDNLEKIGEAIFEVLNVIRVYTKSPNKEPDPEPLVVRRGSKVIEVAEMIHKRLAEGFKYAKVWGKSVKFGGQRVGAEHVLEDGDIIEIYSD